MAHIPVLLKEVLEVLDPKPGEFFIDGTFGSGGHSNAIKEKIGPEGTMLSIDWEKTGENFADLPEILKSKNLNHADGLVLDLGFSSEQLDNGKGFSFRKDEPLMMTYNDSQRPAKQVLKDLSEEWLAKIIKEFGEERYAGRIASAIKNYLSKQSIETSGQLAEIISSAVPKNYERGRIHPATRTFQALRIYTNQELENLGRVLGGLENILKSGGRVAIISFHSLEDRMVKNHFRDWHKEGKLKILTKKPIMATDEEIKMNPRSRSAKMRAAQML